MRTRRATLISTVAILCAPALAADTIFLTDGTTVPDCTIQLEGLQTVTYKEGKNRGDVASDKVLFIEYERKPQLVDRAEGALNEDLYLDALDDLLEYVDGVISADKPPRRFQWAPAYAMYRLVVIQETMGEFDAVVSAADRLIQNAADSRFVPYAYLKKADALNDLGKASAARKTLSEFSSLIEDKGLSNRWKLERDLATLLFDPDLKGKARRERLEDLSGQAGVEYPIARNRAEVAIAESLLGQGNLKDAEKVFKRVTADPKADNRTLAAAYTGMGDCLFKKGTQLNSNGEDGSSLLNEALLNYMRVVVVYKQELRYVPKAMFWAGRVLDQSNDDESQGRAQKLYKRVRRDFRGSKWGEEARGFIK